MQVAANGKFKTLLYNLEYGETTGSPGSRQSSLCGETRIFFRRAGDCFKIRNPDQDSKTTLWKNRGVENHTKNEVDHWFSSSIAELPNIREHVADFARQNRLQALGTAI